MPTILLNHAARQTRVSVRMSSTAVFHARSGSRHGRRHRQRQDETSSGAGWCCPEYRFRDVC